MAQRLGYLIVPLTRQGMVQILKGEEAESSEEDLLYLPFSQEEAAALRPIMQEFERAFGFDAEGSTVEQVIDTRHADTALRIAAEFAEKDPSASQSSAAQKAIRAFSTALECGSFVEFALD